ncbi:MAG TPA: hypothetical protein VFU89_03725, partial [Rhabdochlamydiaceae bacterium]|nr:hypothetical protein [Rhabdochlamydiaceae bacterium]
DFLSKAGNKKSLIINRTSLHEEYTERDSKVGFWPRWLRCKFSSFARALCTHNGRLLQENNLRGLLAKFPTFESRSV